MMKVTSAITTISGRSISVSVAHAGAEMRPNMMMAADTSETVSMYVIPRFMTGRKSIRLWRMMACATRTTKIKLK